VSCEFLYKNTAEFRLWEQPLPRMLHAGQWAQKVYSRAISRNSAQAHLSKLALVSNERSNTKGAESKPPVCVLKDCRRINGWVTTATRARVSLSFLHFDAIDLLTARVGLPPGFFNCGQLEKHNENNGSWNKLLARTQMHKSDFDFYDAIKFIELFHPTFCTANIKMMVYFPHPLWCEFTLFLNYETQKKFQRTK